MEVLERPPEQITSALCAPAGPCHCMRAMPGPPANTAYSRDSCDSYGARTLSRFTATSRWFRVFSALWSSPKLPAPIRRRSRK